MSTTGKKTSRTYLRAEARREQLRAAAAELVGKRGWEGLGMIPLAEAAGVSRQLVYEHFENVDALHLEVTRYLSEEVFRAVSEALERHPEDLLAHLSFEATPAYMHRPAAVSRMAELLPDARLIVLLRDPVERAFSNYKSARQKGLLSASFEKLIDRERAWLETGRRQRGVAETRQFLGRGIYVEQLERIFRVYPRDRALVLSSEEMFADPQSICDQVFEFLGLPATWVNVEGHANRSEQKAMSAETRRGLVEFFEPYNRRLYALLERDFGWPSRSSASRRKISEPDVVACGIGSETARLDSIAEGFAQASCARSCR